MVIGEGPGAQEDASGSPFVGRAGQLLDRMLASVGIDSNRDAYICNVVKCRPPENRKPSRPGDGRLPALAAAAGGAGATAGDAAGRRHRGGRGAGDQGRHHPPAGPVAQGAWQGRWCLPIFHPSYLLRNPSREPGDPKWHTWQDLKAVRRRLDQLRAAPDLAPDSSGDP